MCRALKSILRARRAAAVLYAFLLAADAFFLPVAVLALGGPPPVTVFAEGEVRRPGSYTLPAGGTLSALIVAAGGFSDAADLRGAVLSRMSIRASQQGELRGMAAGLLRDAGPSEPAQRVARSVEKLLSGVRAAGRVPVTVTYPRLLKNTRRDVPLRDGDTLRIPARTATVAVAGAVRAASGAIPFSPGLPYEDYIRQAGGYADYADRDQVFLMRADGTTALLSLGPVSWNPEAFRWEVTALTGGPPPVDAGDTVVVPHKPPPGLPSRFRRGLARILVRASEIAGAPVVLP